MRVEDDFLRLVERLRGAFDRLFFPCGGHFADNFERFGRRHEDRADILEKVVAHEAATNDFDAFEASRNRHDAFFVEFDHRSVFVFRKDGEEVQESADILAPPFV